MREKIRATSAAATPSLASRHAGAAMPGEGSAGPGDATRRSDWSALMARAQEGDRAAYRRLLVEVTPPLRKLAAQYFSRHAEVEDAVQDVLLTVHSIRHTYDPARPFAPWLTAIARRRMIDHLRRLGRQRSREMTLELEHETFAAPPSNRDDEAAMEHALRDAVASLPEGQRQAVMLLKMNEMSLKEAAAATGLSVASLKVATHRAIGNLRKMLRKRSEVS